MRYLINGLIICFVLLACAAFGDVTSELEEYRLDSEIVNERLVIRNFSTSGGGWSLLPACVDHSLKLLQLGLGTESIGKRVVVIGTGCTSLLTAIRLKQAGYAVELVGKNTSKDSAELICLFPLNGVLTDHLGVESYRYYAAQAVSETPEFKGLQMMPVYVYGGQGNAEKEVNVTRESGVTREATRQDLLFVNPTLLLRELRKKVKELEIPTSRRVIKSLADVEGDVIFDCQGI